MNNEEENDERKFLHDLASPLSTAIFLLDAVLDAAQNKPNVDPDEIIQLSEAYQALEKIKIKLQERRDVLIKRGVPSTGAKK